MRSLFYPVLLLIVAMLGGLIWLVFRPPWMSQVPQTLAAVFAKKEDPKADKPSPMEEQKKQPAKKSANVREPVQMTYRVEMQPMQPNVPPAIAPRFPLASSVSAGTARAALLASFGQPDATAVGSDTGQLRERYVYVDKATGRKTFISLLNGNVISAETLIQ
jgi:hypothetical protein